MSYEADIARARRFISLVKEGFASSLTEAATRFALSPPATGTILVGMATLQQFQDALAAVQKGSLAAAALDRLTVLQQGFVGEPFITSAVAIAPLAAWAQESARLVLEIDDR